MAEVDQFPQDLHQETPEDVSPGSDDNQTSHLPKKTYASVAEKSFNGKA